MYPAAYRPYAVRIETAVMGGSQFLEETVHVLAADAEQAQDLAIAYIEARGDCHRHVMHIHSIGG